MTEPAQSSTFTNTRFLVMTGLILVTTLFRLVDHGLINVAPVGAIALFGGACFATRKQAFGVTLGSMLLSDLLLYSGRYRSFASDSLKSMVFVYLAFAAVVAIGCLLRNRKSFGTIALGSLVGSIVFFLVSNLSAWLLYPDYEKTFSGLMQCYFAGIPFIRGQSPLFNTVVADLCFNGALFGAWALLERRVTAAQPSLAN